MIKFDDRGLVPVVVQDCDTGEVLMLAYADKEALKRTLESGEVWFYSRSRKELWHKGETSGSILKVHSLAKDCDSDAILIKARPGGPVCHTGNRSCFFQDFAASDLD